MGAGDFHDAKYDDMGISAFVNELGSKYAIYESFYSGFPLDDSSCPMLVTIYPSGKTEDSNTSSTPWVFALVTGCVFLLTVLAFIIYNYVVERRQRIVLKSATKSNALISTLFPEAVKHQLMETQTREKLSDDAQARSRLTGFLNDGSKKDSQLGEDPSRHISDEIAAQNAKQIAELFPETTVLFADIAGFTAWASVREPSHVFTLLETLYGAFDRKARKMGVFKVETIGDCYVAVCGLPEPSVDHALKMARFAFSCILEMQEIVRKLELSLGPGTSDLSLRVGLHSGPTIAGVLRGERARFQLFGDTVRMI